MAEKNEREFEEKISYVLGLVSILISVSLLSPFGGVVSGISGIILSKKSQSSLGKRARNLSKWGIFLGAIILVILVAISAWATLNGLSGTTGLPQY